MPPRHRPFFLPHASLLGLAWATGCESGGTGTGGPPPPPTSATTVRQAVIAAHSVQKADDGRTTLLGGGRSMMPLYGTNTVLVYAPIAYTDLEEGMVVAYTNGKGVVVTHRLVKKGLKGWIAMGDNNHALDDDYVTAENLIGVVYTVLYTQPEAVKP